MAELSEAVERFSLNRISTEEDDKVNSGTSHHLHPNSNTNHLSSGNGSAKSQSQFSKKGSSASQTSISAEFGKGERRSPPPERTEKMLKHATGAAGKQNQGQSQSQPPAASSSAAASKDEPKPNPRASLTEEPSTNIKLPQRFVVKYLGFRETSYLWGIKYTRRPVDDMVAEAKRSLSESPEKALALLKLEVTEEGISVGPMPQNSNPRFPKGKFAIETISYGVQDLIYTRVFAMITVKTDGLKQTEVKLSDFVSQGTVDEKSQASGGEPLPFRCHAFVCDSRQTARRLTYSLASAFEIFSKKVDGGKVKKPKKFAIDLRPAEELEAEMAAGDSEA